MNKKSIIGAIFLSLGLTISTTSCEDMLTPDLERYAEGFNGKDTVGFYLGILNNLQGMVEQNVLLGDIRSDLAATTAYASDSVSDIANFRRKQDGDNMLLNRSAYYKVINQCNYYLSTVDLNAKKNNDEYMRREAAQVMLIRAWVYMQLVQNYKEVPFITQPVDNANTGWETNSPEGVINVDNLLEKLLPSCQLVNSYEIKNGLPYYGDFYPAGTNGGISISHRFMLFPSDLIIADLYLLSGRDKSDYVNAAKHYYKYIKDNSQKLISTFYGASYFKTYTTIGGNRREDYRPNVSNWTNLFRNNADNNNTDIMAIPTAANTVFGNVLTRIPGIYGFESHSSNTTGAANDQGEAATTGRVSIIANYKYRQVTSSERFEALGRSQAIPSFELEGSEVKTTTYIPAGDPRVFGTAPEVSFGEYGKGRVIQKFGASSTSNGENVSPYSFNFRYKISLYRTSQVMLRFAEALNRAGYPRHAFAILYGGLRYDKLPTIKAEPKGGWDYDDYEYDDEAETKKLVPSAVTVKDGTNCIDINELRRAKADPEFQNMLDFTTSRWQFDGIHNLGSGQTPDYEKDTRNIYEVLVATRILEEADRRGSGQGIAKRAAERLLGKKAQRRIDTSNMTEEEIRAAREDYAVLEPDEPTEADPLEIDAVETLIADQCALETGFEGYRFYDLIRIARHKNNDVNFPADNGTSWLAWSIARRNAKSAYYENVNDYDTGLYSLLMNIDNWYLKNPEY